MPYHVGEIEAAREPNSPQMPKPKAKQQRQTAPACHSMHNKKKQVRGNLHTASCNQATTVQRGLPRRVFSSGTAKSGPIGRTDKGCQQRSNIAQQLNSGSRKTRRSSITRQGRNNWQRQRNTQITQRWTQPRQRKRPAATFLQTAVLHPPPASRAMMSISGGNSCTGNTARTKDISNPGNRNTKRVVGFGDTCPYGLWIRFTL